MLVIGKLPSWLINKITHHVCPKVGVLLVVRCKVFADIKSITQSLFGLCNVEDTEQPALASVGTTGPTV